MALSLLAPWALWLATGLPLLVIPHLLREKRRRTVVSALLLYRGLPQALPVRLWRRVRLTPLFFLELAILLLLILSAARPVLTRRVSFVGVILDNSASMQARTAAGGETAIEAAKRAALDLIGQSPPYQSVGVFVTSPQPHASLPPTAPRDAAEHVAGLSATDAPDPTDDALHAFTRRLITEEDFGRLVLFTDRRPGRPRPDEDALAVASVGEPAPNLGIADFGLYRSAFFPQRIEATVSVGGSGPGGPIKVTVYDGDTLRSLAEKSAPLRPQGTTLAFHGLPRASVYRARLEPGGALPLDDEAFAVLPPLDRAPVQVVTAAPEAARTLDRIPNLALTVSDPHDYDPGQAGSFLAVLFHLTVPRTLPATNAAFILPPGEDDFLVLGAPASRSRVTQWVSGHPLTSYLDLTLLSPPYAQGVVQAPSWLRPVITSTAGPVVLAGERGGKRYAALGFDVLPYLADENLPVSILTLNLLSWLTTEDVRPPARRTGEPLARWATGRQVVTPGGEVLSSAGGGWWLLKQGVYTVVEEAGAKPTMFAVNLFEPKESLLGRAVEVAALGKPATPAVSSLSLWPALLAAAVVLLGVEWHLGSRRRDAAT